MLQARGDRNDLSELTWQANRCGIDPQEFGWVFDAITAGWTEAGKILEIDTRDVPPLAEIYAAAADCRLALECSEPEVANPAG